MTKDTTAPCGCPLPWRDLSSPPPGAIGHYCSRSARLLPPEDQAYGVEIHTVDGMFIKEMRVPKKESVIPQHSHVWDHTSFLAKGSVFVWKANCLDKQYRAPAAIFIKAGIKHTFMTLEDDTIIYCLHNLHGEQAVQILEEHNLVGEV